MLLPFPQLESYVLHLVVLFAAGREHNTENGTCLGQCKAPKPPFPDDVMDCIASLEVPRESYIQKLATLHPADSE